MSAIVAHRGLHVSERENTVAAFKAAVDLGVDGVELDVRRTRDGVLVVHHDAQVADLSSPRALRLNCPPTCPPSTRRSTRYAGGGQRGDKESPSEKESSYDATGAFAREVVTHLRASGWASR